MKVLVAMSGGVDSSVAVALLQQESHEVVGATMKLWGGVSDSGCCSLSDVDDARRVAQQLGIVHHVFNFGEEFIEHIVDPYVSAHATGRTPNPCIECNRHVKFDRLLERALDLGFDAIATGHHARITNDDGVFHLRRGADHLKDQSYVLHMLPQSALSRTLLPVGEMTKDEVRRIAGELNLRTAKKPDSQDVCFILAAGGRSTFLGDRIPLKPGNLVDVQTGENLGSVDAVELVTIGQRKGMGGGTLNRRYAVDVDVENGIVKVGDAKDLLISAVSFHQLVTTDAAIPVGSPVRIQVSAHGTPCDALFQGDHVDLLEPQRRVAPGQSIVFYQDDVVLGGALVV